MRLRDLRLRPRTGANVEWQLRQARDESDVHALLSGLRPDATCVDVGAHSGEFLRLFARYAPYGKHVAIEPLPDFAERLRNQFPNVEVLELALNHQSGTQTFFRPVGRPAWSSLRPQETPDRAEVESFPVQTARLDDVACDADFVKIDVEGAEAMVLSGAERLLAEIRPVFLVEYAMLHAAAYGTTPQAFHDRFTGAGYSLSSLRGVQLDREEFIALCERSHASGYDRNAETNWVARPN